MSTDLSDVHEHLPFSPLPASPERRTDVERIAELIFIRTQTDPAHCFDLAERFVKARSEWRAHQ